MNEPSNLTSTELKRAKRDVRRSTLAARDAIEPSVRAELARAVAHRFLALPQMDTARIVLAFWSFGSELPMSPLIEAMQSRGIAVALPHIVEGEMLPRRYEPGDLLTETSFGALEPTEGARVDPETIDVVATPAVAFDRKGARVGYGGGFYDRFFPRTRAECLRAGVALGVQVLPPGEFLPGGHFDLRVDLIVTETETIRCPQER
ncbi:MAG TPA: 5-formyltetrahydrofolate cyclo-ligase [Actinomycetota bacterium]